MYEVWATQGQGPGLVDKYNTLKEALEVIKEMEGEASFAIKLPNGRWHKWEEET